MTPDTAANAAPSADFAGRTRSSSVQRVAQSGQHQHQQGGDTSHRGTNQINTDLHDLHPTNGRTRTRTQTRTPPKNPDQDRSAWLPRAQTPLDQRRPSVVSGVDLTRVAGMYDVFLRIRTDNADIRSRQLSIAELTKEYEEYKISNCNLTLTLAVSLLLVIYFIVGVIANPDVFYIPSADPFITTSVSFSLVCIVLLIVIDVHRFFVITDYNHPTTAWLKRVCQALSQSPLTLRLISDSLPVFLALRTGFAILSRVGLSCETGRLHTPSRLYDCVPRANGGQQGLPSDTYALCLYIVLLPQMFVKGASRGAICLGW